MSSFRDIFWPQHSLMMPLRFLKFKLCSYPEEDIEHQLEREGNERAGERADWSAGKEELIGGGEAQKDPKVWALEEAE